MFINLDITLSMDPKLMYEFDDYYKADSKLFTQTEKIEITLN